MNIADKLIAPFSNVKLFTIMHSKNSILSKKKNNKKR